jgi:hypothetical protein
MTEDALLQLIERAAKENRQSLDLRNNQLRSLPLAQVSNGEDIERLAQSARTHCFN